MINRLQSLETLEAWSLLGVDRSTRARITLNRKTLQGLQGLQKHVQEGRQ